MRTALATVFLATTFLWATAPVPADLTEAELKEKALKLNKEATNEESADKQLKELIKDKTGTPKLVKVAAQVLKDAKDGEKFRFYPALVLAKAAHNAKEYDAAEAFYKYSANLAENELKSGKMIVQAYITLIDYYTGQKQYPKAIEACKKFLELDGDATLASQTVVVLEKKLKAMVRNNEGDAAIDEINRFIKRFKTNLYYVMIKASVQREAGKLEDAADTYNDLLATIEGDAEITDEAKKYFGSSIRYTLSSLYGEMNKVEKSIEMLEKLMKDDPRNATFKNDLGFMMADNNMKLEESEKLIRDAIDMDLAARKKLLDAGQITEEVAKKANSAFIDSLGWVLFKRGKHQDALKYLLESAGTGDDESDHLEIWDHVGDCYLAMGNKKDALKSFEKALTMEDASKKDAARRKVIAGKVTKLKDELK